MEREQVANAYGRWAPIYDSIFGPVFRRGRLDAVAPAGRFDGRILTVGAGAGLSLPMYSCGTCVGIDIPEPMLDKEWRSVQQENSVRVESIAVSDAENMDLPIASFDVVVAQFVVTVVPRPERALEFVRALRPGDGIIATCIVPKPACAERSKDG